MEVAWIGVIGTVSGVILGGGITFVASILKLRQEDKLDRRKILIERLEESHTCLEKIKEAANLLNAGVLKKMAMKSNFEVMLKEKIPMERLSMLIHFYSPTLAKNVEPMEIKFSQLLRQVGKVIMSIEPNDEERGESIVQCAELAKEISDQASEIQKKLAENCVEVLK